MKLLIVGSRGITDFELSPYIPCDVDTVISGGANGIDSLAAKYADLHRLSYKKRTPTDPICRGGFHQ